MQPIRVKAFALIKNQDKILVEPIYEFGQIKGYRLLGGSIEHSERAIDAIQREIEEELGAATKNHQLVSVVENIFEYEGRPGHEIVFVFECDFCNQALYNTPHISHEDAANPGKIVQAYWVNPLAPPDNLPIWPEAVLNFALPSG